MTDHQAKQAITAQTPQPTVATPAPSGIPANIVNAPPAVIVAYITSHPEQRSQVLIMVTRARGSTFVRDMMELDPAERHEAARSASSDAIAAEIDLLDARVIEAIGHASAGTGNPADESKHLAQQANDLFELVRGTSISDANKNLLGPRLHQLDRSVENYRATLAHRQIAATTDGIERWLGYAHQLLGQTVEGAKEFRPAQPMAKLEHNAIGEHLEAAYEASRSIRAGNANLDTRRLRLHLSSACTALETVTDHDGRKRHRGQIHKLLDELIWLDRMHPEITGTLEAEVAALRKAAS